MISYIITYAGGGFGGTRASPTPPGLCSPPGWRLAPAPSCPFLTRGCPFITRGRPILTRGCLCLTRGCPLLTFGRPILTRGCLCLTRGCPQCRGSSFASCRCAARRNSSVRHCAPDRSRVQCKLLIMVAFPLQSSSMTAIQLPQSCYDCHTATPVLINDCHTATQVLINDCHTATPSAHK